MDQLKPYLIAIKKHHFWILLAVVIIASGVVWSMATEELSAQFDKDKRTNKSAFDKMQPLRSNMQTNEPPNAQYKVEVDKTRETLAAGVKEAWKRLYDRQMGVLKVNDRVPEMVDYLINEKFITKDIPQRTLETFHNTEVIEADFKELFTILNLRRPNGLNPVEVDKQGAEAKEGPPEGVLLWAAKPVPRQLMLRYVTTNTPSTVRVRMLYEDLWVFKSMFKVIAKINSKPIDVWLQIMEGGKPADALVDQANVPIKRIDFCDLAQYATAMAMVAPGRVAIAEEDVGKATAGFDRGAGGFNVGVAGTADEDAKLRDGRYIDGRNQPVADPSAPPFAEFKQIFVQMTVLMDQRLIPVLVSECANAELTIETRQVLVDLSEVDKIRRADANQAAQQADKVEQSPHDAIVTIRGVVYGYSPPDEKKLGTGSDPEPSKRDYGIPSKISEATGP